MNKTKQLIMKLPEYYMLILAMLVGYNPPFSFTPVSLGLAAIVIFQIVFKNKISGLVISALFLLINMLLLFALIFEFKEFPTFNSEAKQLLSGGLLIWLTNLFLGGLMFYKNRIVSTEHFSGVGQH